MIFRLAGRNLYGERLKTTLGAVAQGIRYTVKGEHETEGKAHLRVEPAEVERVLALGARHVDIGQGDESWVVLADPEGNEFCILAAKD